MAGVYFCKFPNQKYIFVKNGNKKYKNKKSAVVGGGGTGLGDFGRAIGPNGVRGWWWAPDSEGPGFSFFFIS